jgi:hypothetical protein
MRQAQPASATLDHHAKRIARAIAKAGPPPFSPELELFCANSQREIFAALASASRHMPPGGNDATLALGYLFLLERLLEHLRYRTDRGYADAAKLIADFQSDVAARADAGEIDPEMLALVSGALHQAQIPAAPELVAAATRHPPAETETEALPSDIHVAVAGMVEGCGGDPFLLVETLRETGHAVAPDARAAMAAVLAHASAEARSVAVLLLLDDDPAVRAATAAALGDTAASLSPVELRRLIAIRNWRPEKERAGVDAVIRKARTSGIACAQWPSGSIETILATAIDGSGAQGFLVLTPGGRRKQRLSSILTKSGMLEVCVGEPERQRQIATTLTAAAMEASALEVSRAYLDRAVAHHLGLCIEKGQTPAAGLLQVAEVIGGADWQPIRLDFTEALEQALAGVPERLRNPAAVTALLRDSDRLADLQAIERSWFEDNPQVAQAVRATRGRNRAKLADYLLQNAIARQRQKWTELILRTALWMREAAPEAQLCWRELVIIAKALSDGRDMDEIALMRAIAVRTIEALARQGGDALA